MDDFHDPEDLYDIPFVHMELPRQSEQDIGVGMGQDRPLTDQELEVIDAAVTVCPDMESRIRQMTTSELRATVRMAVLVEHYQFLPVLPDAVIDELRALNAELGFDARSEVEWAQHLSRARCVGLIDDAVRNLCTCGRVPDWAQAIPFEQKVVVADRLIDEAVTCAEMILTTQPVGLPNHLCYDTLVESTARFASNAFPVEETPQGEWPPRGVELQLWHYCWPLPVGELSLQRFARASWLKRPQLPTPLLPVEPDAEVGLVIERRIPAGRVRLFGLVGRDHEMMEEGIEVLHFLDAYIEKVPDRTLYHGEVPPMDQDPLHRVAQDLDRWYRETVSGQKVENRGRPTGPPDEFREREVPAYQAVVAEMKRSYRTPTYTSVATAMGEHLGYGVPRTTLQFWVQRGWLPPLPGRSG